MWRDGTSYQRGREGKEEPTIWRTKIESINLSVHRYVGCEEWFITCENLNIRTQTLYSMKIEDAKKEALILVKSLLRDRQIEDAKAMDAISLIIHQGGKGND